MHFFVMGGDLFTGNGRSAQHKLENNGNFYLLGDELEVINRVAM